VIPLLEALERVLPLLGQADVPALLLRAASQLPDAWYCAALEARLASDEGRVDLLVCARADDGGREHLLRALPQLISASPETAEAWRRVEDFCRVWATEGSVLHADVPFVWLEFDLEAGRPGPPSPFLFFCLQPDFLARPMGFTSSAGPQRGTEARQLRLIDEGLGLLLGPRCWPRVMAQLERCLRALPPEGQVLHLAPLAQRAQEAARLVVTIPRPEVIPFLQAIGCPGPLEELRATLDALHAGSRMVGVQLDVGEAVRDPVGLQFFYRGPDPRWVPLLDALVARGLCTRAGHERALSWSGEERVAFHSRVMPLRLRRELELKLVFRRDQAPEAKAYFGFGADFLLFSDPASTP
jgi:hypothetical protein